MNGRLDGTDNGSSSQWFGPHVLIIEQLIISILDDPGVSRMMREAGFSSSQVKIKVEEYVSLKICSNKSEASKLVTTTLLMNAHGSCKFKEMNAENLETLCDALRSKAPRQKDVIPEIAKAILKCRSGSIPRKIRDGNVKQETWLIFQGVDAEAKEKMARELAKLVFGSENSFVSFTFSSSTMEDLRSKRRRDKDSLSYTQRFFEAVSCNPHRVFFMEDIEEADYLCLMGFKRALERGRIQNGSGEEAYLRDAIVILSCERFSLRSRPCLPLEGERNMKRSCVSLDLNLSLDHDDDNDGYGSDHIGLRDAVDACILFSVSST